ncbi:Leucine-rich repeat protein kinase family protein [Abeliophyllum distichum]|uniref:Leucine-rich repeat protein kinase family protein n=1 Tax=Abeliophyllum distichum TaxID=126358 RepID=A0ABD1VCQ3_9LAMI
MNLRLLVPMQTKIPKIKCNIGLPSWQQRRASAGLFIGLLVCFSTSGAANAEAPESKENKEGDCDASAAHSSHGKEVYTDYSVIGIPGDGRCLFRSVAHGACLRSGKSAPNESLQRELADELRAMVADEFVKRREETEWFIEGDFDTYVSQIRKHHVWGGEPELLMASHVLRMPITVYMYDDDSGGLISIAEYGQEYGKDNPIKVLYHGFGHYDALHIPDGVSLLALRAAITEDPKQALTTWVDSDSTPCKWAGIICDEIHHKVTSIELSSKNLTGYIPSEIGAFSFLTFLDLSHNFLYGPLPHRITTLQNLTHLDLSSNSLSGSLPQGLSNLTHLIGTLNLSFNQFSGEIPASFGLFPVMLSLDLRHNNLTGKIPEVGSLLNQGPTAFSGNLYLCGFPLNTQCTIPEAQNPRFSKNPQKPENPGVSSDGFVENKKIKIGPVTFSVISGVLAVAGLGFLSVWVRRKWRVAAEGKTGKEENVDQEVRPEEGQKGKFAVVDEGFGLELEDLLRASAYVIGKSRSGIVYKVVVGSGGKGVGGTVAVAVRRLSEGDNTRRFKEFEAEVEAIGRVHHPNIVKLRAYYYASDEKLLVSDFIRNGSLYTALHGGPANSLPPLSWEARLGIAQGVAKGLMHIHECSPRKYIHGNIKSSKILLDDDLKPYISGFGLTRLVSGTSKSPNSASRNQNPSQNIVSPKGSTSSSIMYMAPEARDAGCKFTQKCDVYSFGILLLEILTGRAPDVAPDNDRKGLEGLVRKIFREEQPLSKIIDPALLHEVHAKKQVVAAFHIALSCTELDPDFRPRMRTVSENLDCIKSW